MIVYLIVNRINGKRYIGQTKAPLLERWQQHQSEARNGSSLPIHCAIRKYGLEAFSIQRIATAFSREELDFLETRFINWLQSSVPLGYNLTSGGTNGYEMSEETRSRMGKSHRGKHHSAETCKKIRERTKGRMIVHTKESREKISRTLLGRKKSKATRKRISLSRLRMPLDRKQAMIRKRAETISRKSTT